MKIFITARIPDEILKRLSKYELNYHDSEIPLTKEEIIEGIKDAEVLLCPLSDKIDREVLEAGKNLKLVANYGAGYDNIDTASAKEMGIYVTNAPAPSSSVSTAELTFGLMLAISRRIVEGERLSREDKFLGWRPTYMLGHELRGKTLGIFGLGNIGSNLAKRALAFEMNVIYHSRNRKEEMEKMGVKYVDSLDELLEKSDFVSLHSAFKPELKHMISTNEFKKMKKSAYLINAARGPLVEEKELIKALNKGEIAGCALDVYEFEPKISEELKNAKNILLAPHLGNATFEARLEMGNAAADNIEDYEAGKEPRNNVAK